MSKREWTEGEVAREFRRLFNDLSEAFDARLEEVRREHWKSYQAAIQDVFEGDSRKIQMVITDSVVRILRNEKRGKEIIKRLWNEDEQDKNNEQDNTDQEVLEDE